MATRISGARHTNYAGDIISSVAANHNVSRDTLKPISYEEVKNKIGDKAALLMLSLMSFPYCSKESVEASIDIIRSIAGDEMITVSHLSLLPMINRMSGKKEDRIRSFTLATDGFLNSELEGMDGLSCYFQFTPEHQSPKSLFLQSLRGYYRFDLKIDLILVRKDSGVTANMATVIAEYDGPIHVNDEQVRKDKARDSSVQSTGATVFRIQTPYKNNQYKTALSETKVKTTDDIKEYFRNILYRHLDVSSLINDEKNRDAEGKGKKNSFVNK